jgi:putative endonuclease
MIRRLAADILVDMTPRWWHTLQHWWHTRRCLGARGEAAAARLLRRSGYRILARNLRTRMGEIDILAEHRRDRTIVLVEVKSAACDTPPPEQHVHFGKQRKLTALAHQLVKRYHLENRLIRFDVVGVVWPPASRSPTRITHHVNAFQAAW